MREVESLQVKSPFRYGSIESPSVLAGIARKYIVRYILNPREICDGGKHALAAPGWPMRNAKSVGQSPKNRSIVG